MDENNKTFNDNGVTGDSVNTNEPKPPRKKFSFNKSKLVKGIAGALLLGSTVSSCVLLSKVYGGPQTVTKEEFDDLMNRISDIETSIAAHTAEISKAKEKLATMEESIKHDKEAIDALQKSREGMELAIKTLNEQLVEKTAELEKAIADGDAKLEAKLKEQAEALNKNLEKLEAKLLEETASLKAADAALELKIVETKKALEEESAARKAAIEDLANQLKAANEAIKEHAQKIQTYDTKFVAVETQIQNISNQIADLSKKVADDIQSLQNSLDTEIEQRTAAFAQLAEEVVAMKDLVESLAARTDACENQVKAAVATIENLATAIEQIEAAMEEQKETLVLFEKTKQNIISLYSSKIVLIDKSEVRFDRDFETNYKDKIVDIISDFDSEDSSYIHSDIYFPEEGESSDVVKLEGTIKKHNRGDLFVNLFNVKDARIYYAKTDVYAEIPGVDVSYNDEDECLSLYMIEGIAYTTSFTFVNGILTIYVDDFSNILTLNAVLSQYKDKGSIVFEGGTPTTKGFKDATITGTITLNEGYHVQGMMVSSNEEGIGIISDSRVIYDDGAFEVILPSIRDLDLTTLYVIAVVAED